MSLINKLPDSNLGLKGIQQKPLPGSLSISTLHNTTSINNIPAAKDSRFKPSNFDLNGQKGTPSMSTSIDSTLHRTSSINGKPDSSRKPSDFDRGGVKPKGYRDTPPEGISF